MAHVLLHGPFWPKQSHIFRRDVRTAASSVLLDVLTLSLVLTQPRDADILIHGLFVQLPRSSAPDIRVFL
jgi:hypothetical protein